MTNFTLALPEADAERPAALAKARGESLETLAARVLCSAVEQMGGASVLTDDQRAELNRRLGLLGGSDPEAAAAPRQRGSAE